jgi:hypothetical protein
MSDLKPEYMSRKQLEKAAKELMADSGYDRYVYVPDRVASMSREELIAYINGD